MPDTPRFCIECGSPLVPGQQFCEFCGTRVTTQTLSAEEPGDAPVKSKARGRERMAVVLAIVAAALLMTALLIGVLVLTGTISFNVADGAHESSGNADTTTAAVTEVRTVVVSSEEEQEAATETVETPEGAEPPFFGDAEASSTIPPDGVTSYYGPLNCIDDNTNTAWAAVGTYNNGVGEWIRLLATEPQLVRGVSIMNGYWKSETIYYWNNRPSRLRIEFSDGYAVSMDLQDSYWLEQRVEFGSPHAATWLQVTVEDVYEGNTFTDTCITEIKAF